jgi:c-di-GMP-related signal transduction protein
MSVESITGTTLVEKATEVYVARQPIFETGGKLFGYELLFRSGLDNFFPPGMNQDIAASQVLHNSFLLFGMDVLICGKRAFINMTRKLLVNDTLSLFPRDCLVVEILENIEPDEEVIASCTKLKRAGYMLALDDFVFSEKLRPLIDLADIVKVDFRATPAALHTRLFGQVRSSSIRFLAEKIETQEEARQAQQMGYSLFQGYFYSRPLIIQGKDIPGYKLNYLQLLQEAMAIDLSMDKMGSIITRDVSLAYKLLRFVNSAAFGFRQKIHSIHHALALMGVAEIRKWVSLVALSGMGRDKCDELVVSSLIRARFCEMLAWQIGMSQRSSDLFLMGIFSMIDAFLDRPMEEILSNLPISDEVKVALLGGENTFRRVYELVLAYERGQWEEVNRHNAALGLKADGTPPIYMQSVELANQLLGVSRH